jgi:hypothetical protein
LALLIRRSKQELVFSGTKNWVTKPVIEALSHVNVEVLSADNRERNSSSEISLVANRIRNVASALLNSEALGETAV